MRGKFEQVIHVNIFFRLMIVAALLQFSQLSIARDEYLIDYLVGFTPAKGVANVEIKHTPATGRATKLTFTMPADRYSEITGDGTIKRDGDSLIWVPTVKGASALRYAYRVNNKRSGGGYDARMTADWVIMRGDDLIPGVRVRTTAGADSKARLRFELPKGWTNVDTPFVRSRDANSFVVVSPDRRFDRPVGWLAAGAVGSRREFIGKTEVSVLGPKGSDVRRNDMLAFLNRLIPQFRRAFGELPSKLLIVGDGDPMWRGGLSGPRSLFMHSDRPLISENGTSTLVHELSHVITRIRGADGDDWISEGLAEFYSITLLQRAGLVSDTRADKAFGWMARHGKRVKTLISDRSQAERTARAVTLLRELDTEIRQASKDKKSLDDVVRILIPQREISREALGEAVEKVIGKPSTTLKTPLLT